jgi:hypothetical protein
MFAMVRAASINAAAELVDLGGDQNDCGEQRDQRQENSSCRCEGGHSQDSPACVHIACT